MIRAIRLFLYLLLGVLWALVAGLRPAHADTFAYYAWVTAEQTTYNTAGICSKANGVIYRSSGSGNAIQVVAGAAALTPLQSAGWSGPIQCGAPHTPKWAIAKASYWPSCPTGYSQSGGVCVTNGSVTCPTNSTLTLGVCVANSGYTCTGGTAPIYSDATCGTTNNCVAGTAVTYTFQYGHKVNGKWVVGAIPTIGRADYAGSNCRLVYDPLMASDGNCFSYVDAPTKGYCTMGNFKMDGTLATGSEQSTVTPDTSSPCPSGYALGNVNGIADCYPSASGQTPTVAPPPTTTTKSESSATVGDVTTTTTNICSSSGSCTSTVTTVNNVTGEKGTKITTSVGADTAGKSGQGNTEQANFCRDNPESPMCRGSSISGTCGAVSCDGDAIQCAIAREQAKRGCEWYTENTTAQSLGDNMIAGTDPDAATFPNHPSQLSTTGVGSISQATFLSAAAGLSDQTVAVGARSFVIPWSKWNDILGYMGLIVMAFAFVAAYKIIGVH